MFLIQRECGGILKNGRDKSVALSEADRKTLIKHAHAYLSLKVANVEKHHIVLVARTLVFVVPALGDSTEGEYPGYVCLSIPIFSNI